MQKPQELQDFSWLRGDLIDTADTDDEVNLGLGGDVEVASSACCAFEADLLLLLVKVFLRVGLGTLEDDFARGLCVLQNIVSRLQETRMAIGQEEKVFQSRKMVNEKAASSLVRGLAVRRKNRMHH